MEQTVYVMAAIFTIVTGMGFLVKAIGAIVKNKEKIKSTLAEWTRRGIKVIYVWVSHDNQKTATLHLYLCGEEKSWLFSGLSDKNRDSYILGIKIAYYNPSYNSHSDQDTEEWMSQYIHPLSKEPFPYLVQLVGEYKFRIEFRSNDDEMIVIRDSFKFKKELAECLRKYRIKYVKKAPEGTGRWKIKNRYPVL